MKSSIKAVLLIFFLAAIYWLKLQSFQASPALTTDYIRGDYFKLSDDGAWSWFTDKRALIDNGILLVGSVRGRNSSPKAEGPGSVQLSVFDLKTHQVQSRTIHERFHVNDHANPGLLILGDGRYLVTYTRHAVDNKLYYRISENLRDPLSWQPEKYFELPSEKDSGFIDRVTYTNPIELRADKQIYLFHRSFDWSPNYIVSRDAGQSWEYGGKLLKGRDRSRPYLKYVSDGEDTIHFIATDDHPNAFPNSVYHGFIRSGIVHQSDGSIVAPLAKSREPSVRPWDLTCIFQGARDRVAWISDLQLDPHGRPVVLFTVRADVVSSSGSNEGPDHKLHYARWDGRRWLQNEVAYLGQRLYAGQDDYTGLASIDPRNPGIIYISSNAHPQSGKPLISNADSKRHFELFRGVSKTGGKFWDWQELTANSSVDNIRPIAPGAWDDRNLLVWMRGDYRAYQGDWTTAPMLTILEN